MALTVLQSAEEWSARFGPGQHTALSVGNFDGLHLGHQKLLKLLVERARSHGLRAAVITFDPHPLRLLRPEQAPALIQTLSQRLAGIEQVGVEAALVLRFDLALSQVSAEHFIDRFLVGCMHAGTILVGENFCFGHRGVGDVHLLGEFGEKRGFSVETVPAAIVEGRVVSSTGVRNAIADGNVEDAIPLLGRPFSLTGEICPGAGRGRTMKFPTLNLFPEQELRPKLGVYATESVVGGGTYFSVTNVGTRPTFEGHGVNAESHLFGFSQDLKSGPMEVRFHKRLRDEQKFSGAEALREQIARDVAAAQKYFAGVK
jgi:riboflavin kinase/FMN adenylyltransferase